MNTVPGFERKLSLYAITGAAALAASGSAGASIVYLTVGQSFNSNNPPSSYSLNPSGNVTPDVSIYADLAPTVSGNYEVRAASSPTAGVLLDGSSNEYVAALAFGDLIDPASANWGTGGKMVDSFFLGDWPSSGGDRYLGFYFTDVNGVHAGWADIATNTDFNFAESTFTVIDYAYDTVANEAITAGEGRPVSVPEPASIALLAMGAAGIAAVRRRRANA